MGLTLKELSQLAGCSIRTVNRVLWHNGTVSSATRERVEALLREHHYVPNMAARNLKQSQRKFAGVIVDSSRTAQIFLRKLSDLVSRLAGYGFTPLLGGSADTPEELANALGQWSGLLDHVLFMNMPCPAVLAALPELCARFALHFTVMDAVGELPPEVSALYIEREVGIAAAVKCLYRLGHRRILRVGAISSRNRGWENGRAAVGASVQFHHIAAEADCGSAEAAGAQVVAWLPDAVFCDTDRAAAGILRYALTHGYSVPQDFSLVGFDDDPVASMLSPRLSTVAHPVESLNAAAAEIVAAGRGGSRVVRRFATEFVPRESIVSRLEDGAHTPPEK